MLKVSALPVSSRDERHLAYVERYGLAEPPFSTSPNPTYAYTSPNILAGLRMLLNVVIARTGLGVISGDVGLGKTTLANMTAIDLQARNHLVAYFSAVPGNVRQTEASMMRDIAVKLGLPTVQANSADRYYDAIADLAEAADREDRTVVVIIDEAHLLKRRAMKTILRLLSLQTMEGQLIQVLLSGQNPEIFSVLKSDRALHSRLDAHAELVGFSPTDVAAMINHRLHRAGREEPLFTDAAVAAIVEASRGIPRLVCRIAHQACILGADRQASFVELQDVERASAAMRHSE